MASLFISHSSDDSDAAAEMRRRLLSWGYESLFLDFDPDDGIAVGREWEQELYTQLRLADGVIFLGTPAAVASKWCFAELTLARSSGKPIFPLRIGADGHGSLLGDRQWLDVTDQANGAYDRLRTALAERFDPRDAFAWDPRRPPYPGLNAFQTDDAAVYFGREAKVQEVLRHLESPVTRRGSVAVIGASGTGKSSLVRAGVIPRLRRAADQWVVVPPFTPGERPVASLARALALALPGASRGDIERRLRERPDELVELARDIAATAEGSRRSVLVVVDQAEELVSLAAGVERAAFVRLLSSGLRADSPLWVVATLRSEYLSSSLDAAALDDLVAESVLLGPLDVGRLPQVIEGPARRAGLEFEPGLVTRMVHDTRGGDALPLLAYTLQQLDERRQPGQRTISDADYDGIGGVHGALRIRADQVSQELAKEGLGELVLPTLLRLTRLDAEGEPARRRRVRSELTENENRVVQAFVDARLLTSVGEDSAAVVQVAHESLLRAWSPLSEAIAASRERLRFQSEIGRLAHEWDDAGRSDGYLLRDERLDSARRFVSQTGADAEPLAPLEREYYDASVALEERTRRAERRRRRRAFVVLGAVIAIVTGAAIAIYALYKDTAEQSRLADARAIAGQAQAALDESPDVGTLLSLEAWRAAPNVAEGRLAALSAVARTQDVEALLRSPSAARLVAVAYNPRAPMVAAAGADKSVRVWDLRSRRIVGSVALEGIARQSRGALALRFSPTGDRLAAVSEDGYVFLWRVPDGEVTVVHQPRSADLGLRTNNVAFSADGSTLMFLRLDGVLERVDVATGDPLSPSLKLPPSDRLEYRHATLVSTRSGLLHAYSWSDGVLTTWDLDEPSRRMSRALGTPGSEVAALSSDASRVALVNLDGELSLWDARRRERIGRRLVDTDVVDVAFSGDGAQLVAVTTGGAVRRWNARNGSPIVTDARLNGAASVGFGPDGRTLAVAGAGLIGLWRLDGAASLAVPVAGDPGAPASPSLLDPNMRSRASVAFAGGARVVWADAEGVRVWERGSKIATRIPGMGFHPVLSRDGRTVVTHDDLTKGDGVERRPDRGGFVEIDTWSTAAAPSADGSMVATGERDGRVRLWDAATGDRLGSPVRVDSVRVQSLSFGAADRVLATAGYGTEIGLWDVVGQAGKRHLVRRDVEQPLRGQTVVVRALAFSSEGDVLASGGDDTTVRLWDVGTGRPIGEPLSAGGPVHSLAFTRDGQTLAAVNGAGELRLWDVATRRPLGTPLTAHVAAEAVAFSPDDDRLATARFQGSVMLWDDVLWSDDREPVAERLCRIVSRNLTRREWAQFMPDTPYRRTCPQWPAG